MAVAVPLFVVELKRGAEKLLFGEAYAVNPLAPPVGISQDTVMLEMFTLAKAVLAGTFVRVLVLPSEA